MFGSKLRTWMETHIVRSRKKQHRNKDDKKVGNSSKTSATSPCHIESHSFERHYGKSSAKNDVNQGVLQVQACDFGLPSPASMNNTVRSAVNNLSSPESAYSTGYSTDGTSPGASVPPEYYINIRTGTHYFHSNPPVTPVSPPGLSDITACKVGSVNQHPVSISIVSPRPGRHKREDAGRKKARQCEDQIPESSTEEDIADRLGKTNATTQQVCSPKARNKLAHPMYNNLHRRTESYDESQQRVSYSHEQDSGDSLTAVSGISYQCTSPYLPGASPRQRNRIRTNPWLNTNQAANMTPVLPGSKSYNSQGETSSTVGSSSTLSSSGCKHTSDENTRACMSPRSREHRRLIKDHLRDINNSNSVVFSPVLSEKRHASPVTTCSPLASRSCSHTVRPRSPSSSSSDSSSPSPVSEDDHHGNTSDFSDDDVTLNEMLGKYDESYVYEKETDILSDSDPTDCEDEEVRTQNSNISQNDKLEDFDFIDTGSLVELAHSDSESSKGKLAGHCTYHHLPGHTPESARKLTPKLRESLLRRQAANKTPRDRQSRRHSRSRASEGRRKADSPASQRRFSTYKKTSSQSLDTKNSSEAISETGSPTQLQSRRCRQACSVPRAGETPGKYINLNRVLMERLINNQRNGTRSADGTPVSLRKRGQSSAYNGKYIKNNYVTNLISSDANFNERRSSFEDKKVRSELIDQVNSSAHASQTLNVPAASSVASGPGLHDLDKEGDMKYRQLIQEAENIIEDLQVKSRADFLSPTFRCRNGMERAKPSSPLVFSVPPSPLSLRYDINRDCDESSLRDRRLSNNNSLYEQNLYTTQKEKSNDNEEGLFKTISKTLERIMIRGTSETNRKLDKSVSDPFAKGKRTFVLPSTEVIYANIASKNNQENGSCAGLATPNLLRRSSTGTTVSQLSTYTHSPKHNQNEIGNQKGFRKFFKKSDKQKTPSYEDHLNKFDISENEFYTNKSQIKAADENIYENCLVTTPTPSLKYDTHNTKYLETKNPITDYSPNGNTPTYINGFQQIPWQHRTSQAERLKHLSDLQESPKRKTDSPELPFEEKPSLISFKSFDFGNKTSESGYCPQSEPVKRKIYTCSATFEKLQKSFLRKQPEIHPSREIQRDTDNCDITFNKLKHQMVHLRRDKLPEEPGMNEDESQIERISLASDVTGTG